MSNISFMWRGVFSLLGICALGFLAPVAYGAETVPERAGKASALPSGKTSAKEEILLKARASYYSLKKEGLNEFKCSIEPDWEAPLAELRKTNPQEVERRLKLFKKMHFEFTASVLGNIDVTHRYDGEVPADMAANFEQIYGGIRQMTSGFYATWKGFTLTPFLPEAREAYTLDQEPSQYRLGYEGGGTKVVTFLDPDMAITSAQITNDAFDSTITPKFRKVAGGFLMSGYDAVFEGTSPPSKITLHVLIDYKLVDGFQLPSRLDLQGSSEGKPFSLVVSFVDCHATRR
ncbi:MAG TPA: hypothetical protein VIU46_06000 [Gallionellaceae bacterium]